MAIKVDTDDPLVFDGGEGGEQVADQLELRSASRVG